MNKIKKFSKNLTSEKFNKNIGFFYTISAIKMFLKYPKFEARCSYKQCSYKKKCVLWRLPLTSMLGWIVMERYFACMWHLTKTNKGTFQQRVRPSAECRGLILGHYISPRVVPPQHWVLLSPTCSSLDSWSCRSSLHRTTAWIGWSRGHAGRSSGWEHSSTLYPSPWSPWWWQGASWPVVSWHGRSWH